MVTGKDAIKFLFENLTFTEIGECGRQDNDLLNMSRS